MPQEQTSLEYNHNIIIYYCSTSGINLRFVVTQVAKKSNLDVCPKVACTIVIIITCRAAIKWRKPLHRTHRGQISRKTRLCSWMSTSPRKQVYFFLLICRINPVIQIYSLQWLHIRNLRDGLSITTTNGKIWKGVGRRLVRYGCTK